MKKFFDFIEFEIEDKHIEYRCNKFAEKSRDNENWTLSQIIRFLQYQKERVENKEITSGTLKNFVKSLKVFCEMADISIPWKKITRGLPNARQSARIMTFIAIINCNKCIYKIVNLFSCKSNWVYSIYQSVFIIIWMY